MGRTYPDRCILMMTEAKMAEFILFMHKDAACDDNAWEPSARAAAERHVCRRQRNRRRTLRAKARPSAWYHRASGRLYQDQRRHDLRTWLSRDSPTGLQFEDARRRGCGQPPRGSRLRGGRRTLQRLDEFLADQMIGTRVLPGDEFAILDHVWLEIDFGGVHDAAGDCQRIGH